MDRLDEPHYLGIEAPGVDEVLVVPWPRVFRERVARRVESSDRYRWWVLVAALFGLFSVSFTITILAFALGRIATEFHTHQATVDWVITGPLLAFGVVGPVLGKAGDVWGHRRVYLLGLCGSVIFASLSASAWSAGALITFRVLGVAEGAATGPASMAMIMRVFPEGERVKAMGWWSLVGAGAPVMGVVAGGPIVEHFGWRWIFVAQVPFTLLALVVAFLVLPASERGSRKPIDFSGVATLGLGVTSLLFGLNRGPVVGWSSPTVVGALAVSPIALVGFVVVERAARVPLIPLEWLRRGNFVFPVAVQFFSNLAYMGSFILAPRFLETGFHYGVTRASLLGIARPLSFALTAPAAGYLAVRLGERVAGVFGALAVCASMATWVTVSPGAANLHVIGVLALAGVGLGVASPSMAASIANAVEDENLGTAGAAQQLVTQVGIVVGIQLAETIQISRQARVGLAASYHDAFTVLGLVCVLGVLCALFVRSTPREDGSLSAGAVLEAEAV